MRIPQTEGHKHHFRVKRLRPSRRTVKMYCVSNGCDLVIYLRKTFLHRLIRGKYKQYHPGIVIDIHRKEKTRAA